MTNVSRCSLLLAFAALVCLLLASAGCSSDECSRSSDCPDGQTCVRHSCVPLPDVGDAEDGVGPDADADTDTDADADDDGIGPDADADADADDDGTGPDADADDDGIGPDADADADADDDGTGPDADADADADVTPDVCECTSDPDCPSDSCRVGMCAVAGPDICTCVYFNRGNGTPCLDGVFCNGEEACLDGVCTASASGACPPPSGGDGCLTRTCNESTHACTEVSAPNGTSCDDGRWCSGPDTCSGGECQHAYPCPLSTGNPCTRASCDEVSHCIEIPLMDGESCTDPNPCSTFSTCAAGTCTQRDSLCTDSVPCSTDHCAIAGDGVCRSVATCP